MKKNTIFYFSGTGNSYQVARDLSYHLKDSEVINIAGFNERSLAGIERMGIVFPIYFWGIPNIVKKFLTEVQISKETYVFAVATCGGTPGAALHQINDKLKLQGKHLEAGFTINMPENFIIMYDADKPEIQELKLKNEKDKIITIAKLIEKKELNRLAHGKYIIDYLLGRRVNEYVVSKYPDKDKGYTVNDSCIECGKCVRVCSVKNVVLVDGKPEWQHHCEFCMGCLQICPRQAINWENKTQKRTRYFNPNI